MATERDDAGDPGAMVTVEDRDHFENLRDRRDLLLAAFYADWCGPHVASGTFLEPVAADTPAAVAKVDVEMHRGLADEYAVRSLPTVILFEEGEPVERLVGRQGDGRLRRLVERYAGD